MAEVDRALTACQAALSACLGEQARSQAELWAGEDGVAEVERPEEWIDVVEEALERCNVPGDLVDLDCTAYPCVAVLQGVGDDERKVYERIRKTWTSCAYLQRALGWSGDEPALEEAFGAQVFRPTDCPNELGVMLLAIAPEGTAARVLVRAPATRDGAAEDAIYGSLLTRLAKFEAAWNCAG